MTLLTALAAALVFCAPARAIAQDIQEEDAALNDLPAWAILERGLDLLMSEDDTVARSSPGDADSFDPGEALRHFRAAIARRLEEYGTRGILLPEAVAPYPAAEVGLAKVYEAENSFALAERHYNNALTAIPTIRELLRGAVGEDRISATDASQFLPLDQSELSIRYDLANLHEKQGRLREAEVQWRAIVAEVEGFGSPESREVLQNYQRIFWEEGLDRLLELYRQDGLSTLRAHTSLAKQYLAMGRETVFDHELTVVVKIMSVALEELKRYRPLFTFETVDEALAAMAEYPEIREFIVESGLFDSLERLAQSTYRLHGAVDRAVGLWRLVVDYGDYYGIANGIAYRKAAERIERPAGDPLVVPR